MSITTKRTFDGEPLVIPGVVTVGRISFVFRGRRRRSGREREPEAPTAQNRAGSNAERSTGGASPATSPATTAPEYGPIVSPVGPWPVAT